MKLVFWRGAAAAVLLLCAWAGWASEPNLEELERYYGKALEDWRIPGASVVIVKDGKVVLAKGYGVQELGKEKPVDENTLFAIASNSKAFTSAALGILADRNKVKWDDRVQEHLPWFEVFGDPWISHEMRVEDLLCHRAGFRTYSGDLIWWNTPYSAEEVVRRARYLPPKFGFRRGYGYSNVMFIAAGEVVRAASGKGWSDFVQEEILIPLRMTNTVLTARELRDRSNVATPHGRDEEGNPYPLEWQGWESSAAAGGVITCASDMGKWLLLQLGNGSHDGVKLFSPEQSWKMWTIHTPISVPAKSREENPEANNFGAGLGWFVADYRGTLLVRHGGAYDGMFSHTVMAPKKKLGIAVFSNGMSDLPGALAFYTLDAYLGGNHRDRSAEGLKRTAEDRAEKAEAEKKAVAKSITGTKPSLPLEKYAGRYGGEMYGDAVVELADGGLRLKLLPNPELTGKLVHWQHDVFEIVWDRKFAWFGKGKVQFILDATSEVAEFRMDVPNEDFWFDELEFKRRGAAPSSSAATTEEGKVMGRVLEGSKPLKDVLVLFERYEPPGEEKSRVEVRTDRNGEFSATVAPGKYRVSRIKVFEQETDRGSTSTGTGSHARFVEVAPGSTQNIQIGGTGRRVEGKLIAPEGVKSPAFTAGQFRFLSAKEAPENSGGSHIVLDVAKDGTFAASDVPAGEYRLYVTIKEATDTLEGPDRATYQAEVTVPEGNGTHDLGEFRSAL